MGWWWGEDEGIYSACWYSGGGSGALALGVGDGGEASGGEDGDELHLAGAGDEE